VPPKGVAGGTNRTCPCRNPAGARQRGGENFHGKGRGPVLRETKMKTGNPPGSGGKKSTRFFSRRKKENQRPDHEEGGKKPRPWGEVQPPVSKERCPLAEKGKNLVGREEGDGNRKKTSGPERKKKKPSELFNRKGSPAFTATTGTIGTTR